MPEDTAIISSKIHAAMAEIHTAKNADGQTDRQMAFQLYVYSRLAKVPALRCRHGRVSYDRVFGAFI